MTSVQREQVLQRIRAISDVRFAVPRGYDCTQLIKNAIRNFDANNLLAANFYCQQAELAQRVGIKRIEQINKRIKRRVERIKERCRG